MTKEEKEDLKEYLKDYTSYDLADEFNTQVFMLDTKDFNDLVLLHYFRQKDEIDRLEKRVIELLKESGE